MNLPGLFAELFLECGGAAWLGRPWVSVLPVADFLLPLRPSRLIAASKSNVGRSSCHLSRFLDRLYFSIPTLVLGLALASQSAPVLPGSGMRLFGAAVP